MTLHSLEDLLIEQLRDLLSAERQMVKALPKMARAASQPELRNAFEHHLEETEGQIDRLEQAFEAMGKNARAKTCVAMQGLVDEAKEHLEEQMTPEAMDAALIASAQKAEHYEMASYGSARTWAEQIGRTEVAQLLQATLDEEVATDQKLSQLAETKVNAAAA